ncbi:MAG: hypothetical protein IJU37_01550 [Desulfovibrio sp.]|nr:hypothetical protein [Desulfovibrio sp.]
MILKFVVNILLLVSTPLGICLISDLVMAQEHPQLQDCGHYTGTAAYETCENARKHGLSFNAAALVEGLAERSYAVEFCGGVQDLAEQRHTESILAGGEHFRALYDEHLAMLRHRCIYDPDGWCQSRGLTRK